jgi:hypothetical protein
MLQLKIHPLPIACGCLSHCLTATHSPQQWTTGPLGRDIIPVRGEMLYPMESHAKQGELDKKDIDESSQPQIYFSN